jgi:uncharacterized membrane protein YhhN
MKKNLLTLFFIVALGELVSIALGIELLGFICKPLIMISLGCFYWFAMKKEERSLVVVAGIIMAFAGDVLLMLPSQFVPGLIAFLISHLLYIVAYRQHRDDVDESPLKGVHTIRLAFPIVLAGTGLVIILYPALGDMRIPVIIYAIVLALMVLNALFRFGRTSAASFWMVFSGAVLFMISDSILAINKFLSPFEEAGFVIMLTYMAAQLLIIRGLARHVHPS